jgi:sulfite exporter TauE/SafE
MDASALTTPTAAFVAGLATSLHCAAMCGPLACAVRCKPLNYHGTRLVSYTGAGALLGAFGWTLRGYFESQAAHWIPWLLAGVLVMIAFGLDKRIPQPRFISRILFRARLNRTLGWLTPLLPCGPLWLMYGVAILSGSSASGALLLGSFALGTIPLFLALQAGVWKLQQRARVAWLPRVQQFFALSAAALLVWRAVLIDQGGCCH